MKELAIKAVRKVFPFAFLEPESDRGIERIGHRQYVGGHWDAIGSLQFEFLTSMGLKPENYLLDVACGSLRLGVKAIPYLEAGRYLGIEKESSLVEAGLEQELPEQIRIDKSPSFIISDTFEFDKFRQKADFAIAQSLFSHLPPELIHLCLDKLRPCLADGGAFYATFFEVDTPRKNPSKPHDHGYFAYTKAEMLAFGTSRGYQANYIGDWNHPRNQVMVEYRKKPETH